MLTPLHTKHNHTHTYLLPPCQAVTSNDLPHLLFLFDFREALHHVLQRRQVKL